MSDKREPVAWITKNGKHIPIFADSASEDEKLKARQIQANKSQALERKQVEKVSEYKDLSLEEKKQLVYDFAGRTGVNVRLMGIANMPADTLQMTLNTVEDHLNKYGKDNFILTEITMDENDFKTEESKDACAQITPDGELQLNPQYFTQTLSELNTVYENAVKDKHFVNGDASSFIIHELGHARWNSVMVNLCTKYNSKIEEFQPMYNESGNKQWRFGEDLDLYEKKKAYYHFTEQLWDFQDKCLNSDYLKKKNGGELPLLNLKLLCDPDRNYDDAISHYSTTDIHEMMAEAWSDVVYNGDNASWMSKQVFEEFLRIN